MKQGYYVAEVVEEDGEPMIQFPVETIRQMGWDEHTLLEWIIESEEVILQEKEE